MGASWGSCQKVLRGLKRLQEPIKWPGASDDTPVFPKNKVLAFFEEGNKIGLLGQCTCKENMGCFSARGFTDTEVSQIQRSFTSVLGFLVYIERGNRIFNFINSDSTDQRLSERPLEDSELLSLLWEEAKVIEDYEIREIRKIHLQFFLPNLRHKSEHYDFDRVRLLPLHEIEQLGDGGFSHVYRAKILNGYHDFEEIEQVENGEVAIKSFKGRKDYGNKFCRRERRHNELWKSHRYIIPLLASLNRGDHYMIIFPLANYDLKQLMSKTLPLEYQGGRKAWFQFTNLLSALHHVHTSNGRKGYHFDLKPQNILVRSNGDWALTDFGIAHSKEADFTSATGMDGSSGEYSPPEKTRVRRSFDIWSMGCIGCEIVEWLYNGPQGVDKFRSSRGGKCFSYGNRLRKPVLDVLNSASTRDLLTRGVVECLYNMLKIIPEERVTAKEAETSIRQIMSIPGEGDSGTLSRGIKLTSNYAEDQKEAEGLQLSVMKRRMIMLGEDHQNTLGTIHNLALTYRNMKRFTEAERLFESVMKKRKVVLGEDHPDTLTTMHELASTYWGMERFTEAERLFEYVMKKRKVALGEDHPDTLGTMHNLARTYRDMKRFTEAERLFEYVIEKEKVVLSEDHPDTLNTMQNLAHTYEGMKRFIKAERLYVYVIEKKKVVLGEDHPYTLNTMQNLAHTYKGMKRFIKAEMLLEYVIEKEKVVLGEDHPDTLTTMHNLAYTYEGMKRFTEAERLFEYVIEKRKVVLGEDHPDTLSTMHNLASTYEGMKRFTEAERLFEYVMEKRKVVLGEDHPDTINKLLLDEMDTGA